MGELIVLEASSKTIHDEKALPGVSSNLSSSVYAKLAHPIPYQGSKRNLASMILAVLHLKRLELNAGRSSQATLNGREEVTIESLYVSSNLLAKYASALFLGV